MHIPGSFKVNYGQATTAGKKSANDDSLGFSLPTPELQTTKGIALIIADGVSTAEAGKEAADICVQGFLCDYFSTPDTWQVKTSAHRVLASLNRWLYSKGQVFRDQEKGFVCAMSAVVVKSRTAHLFHVGDTRVYLWREGCLEPITRDHNTWVADHCVLNRAMGVGLHLEIDYHQVELRKGDTLLLSTDGMHDFLPRETIASILERHAESPERACATLLEEALEGGSADNISCQVLRLDRLPEASRQDVLPELARLPFPPPLTAGMVLDGYRVERILSESPRSQIYLVRDETTGNPHAMKTPSPLFEDDPAYIERFLLEEWAGQRAESPHLVRVTAKPRPPQWLYYLMEPIDGITLREWITRNPSPEIGPVVNIIQQLVDGLRALHRREMLHQDLKPENIVITPEGRAVIIDLGSARIASIEETEVPFERSSQLGTKRYSAPEYALGQRPSTRSDLYSLAAIAYEMFSGGIRPFSGKQVDAVSLRDFSLLRYVPVSVHNPLVPNWVDGALRTAMQLDPLRRQEALSEFLAELRHPNPAYLDPSNTSLLERNPIRFWQGLSALFGMIIVILWIVLMRG